MRPGDSMPAWPPTSPPPDEMSDWAIAQAQTLAAARLSRSSFTGLLVNATQIPDEAYQLLCALARTVGVLLRPRGWDGGPIGLPAGPTNRLPLDVLAAARLIGAGARADYDLVRALALAAEAQTSSPAGRHAWDRYWEMHRDHPLTPWQAYRLGLAVAANYKNGNIQ